MPPARHSHLLSLRARWVFPVTSDPIQEAYVNIAAGRIVSVGRQQRGAPVRDLGNVAILPGLVNAHAHLDLSDLAAPLGAPGVAFTAWVRRVMEHRQAAHSAAHAVAAGVRESQRVGTTALAEIAQADWDPAVLERAALDAVVFLELIAPTPDRVPAALEVARRHAGRRSPTGRWHAGLSPHAPYSVHAQLLQHAVRLSRTDRLPVAMHLAETREEIELLQHGTGPLRDLLVSLGAWDPGGFGGPRRPLDYLHVLAQADRALVIHGNHLDDAEIAFLGEHAQHMAVVYCPRTHAFFQHPPYPLDRLLAAGATVALGTDSRASSPDLSLLEEMRFVAHQFPDLPRPLVLALGTLAGATALGWGSTLGSLEPGKRAHLAAVALPDYDSGDPYALLLDSTQPVVAVWYDGVTCGALPGTPADHG